MNYDTTSSSNGDLNPDSSVEKGEPVSLNLKPPKLSIVDTIRSGTLPSYRVVSVFSYAAFSIYFVCFLHSFCNGLVSIPALALVNLVIVGNANENNSQSAFVNTTIHFLIQASALLVLKFNTGMSDYIGRKPMLLLSLITVVGSRLLLYFARSAADFYGMAVILGIGDYFNAVAEAWVFDVISLTERSIGLSMVIAGFASGSTTGVVVGSTLQSFVGPYPPILASIYISIATFVLVVFIPLNDTLGLKSRQTEAAASSGMSASSYQSIENVRTSEPVPSGTSSGPVQSTVLTNAPSPSGRETDKFACADDSLRLAVDTDCENFHHIDEALDAALDTNKAGSLELSVKKIVSRSIDRIASQPTGLLGDGGLSFAYTPGISMLWNMSKFRKLPTDKKRFLWEYSVATMYSVMKEARYPCDWVSLFLYGASAQIFYSTFLTFTLQSYHWTTTTAGLVVALLGAGATVSVALTAYLFDPTWLISVTGIIGVIAYVLLAVSGAARGNFSVAASTAIGCTGMALYSMGTPWHASCHTSILSQYASNRQGEIQGVTGQLSQLSIFLAYPISLLFAYTISRGALFYWPGIVYAASAALASIAVLAQVYDRGWRCLFLKWRS